MKQLNRSQHNHLNPLTQQSTRFPLLWLIKSNRSLFFLVALSSFLTTAGEPVLFATPTPEQQKSTNFVKPHQQSYPHALAVSTTLGGLNAISCCAVEHYLPLWWPFNSIIARIGCTLLLPSLVYAYLSYAEERGITCHQSTMHANATLADWATYLAIKKYGYN